MTAFVAGFLAPVRGLSFILRRGLGRYFLASAVLNLILAVALAILGLALMRGGALALLPAFAAGWVGRGLYWLAFAVAALGLFLLLQPLVGAVILERLTEQVERMAVGTVPSPPAWEALRQALAHGVAKIALFAAALGVALLAGVVTGAGGALGVGLGALCLAYDGFDFPLARRAVSFRGKWRYLALHRGQTLGYCVAASLLYLIPFAIFFAPACLAAGATLVFLESEGGGT